VRCIESGSRLLAAVVVAALAACAQSGFPPQRDSVPGMKAPPPPPPAQPLPKPSAARDWDAFKLQAAQRIVAASPERTYLSPTPEPLLAIPVLEIELDGDGRVRDIRVLRYPTQAEDTTQLAIDAVRRAAPYGDMSRLPKPWKFAEVFLFDDDRRFKPRTLDD